MNKVYISMWVNGLKKVNILFGIAVLALSGCTPMNTDRSQYPMKQDKTINNFISKKYQNIKIEQSDTILLIVSGSSLDKSRKMELKIKGEIKNYNIVGKSGDYALDGEKVIQRELKGNSSEYVLRVNLNVAHGENDYGQECYNNLGSITCDNNVSTYSVSKVKVELVNNAGIVYRAAFDVKLGGYNARQVPSVLSILEESDSDKIGRIIISSMMDNGFIN
ncbi:hypothetical protein GNP81_08100 [Aliivibrio fischeri]|uniref:hypothetical protein n=1 Tax=Aliivibrio fischeri TaxID=668 RepID=UPI0012D994D0|nr:hypothetical protein [Aliivibrio fischeri]MUK60698.1 hypothetical protein [Aliivibrio fischeri]MUL20796.1 hypothetical protein [Aliivibrio fischeri]MUL24571.1 hypothetical protein [Aliivibrio fischeri]